MKVATSVWEYINNSGKWKEAVILLREIIAAEDVEETVKWGIPVYTVNQKNIIGIGAFKSYVGLWFFQGALLKDQYKNLVSGNEGVTNAQRQWRFSSLAEIEKESEMIRLYVQEAITNQKEGKEINPVRKKPVVIPAELADMLSSGPAIKKTFDSLRPSQQREYAEYISEAKKAETKMRRIRKIRPLILEGHGLHDKYRK